MILSIILGVLMTTAVAFAAVAFMVYVICKL